MPEILTESFCERCGTRYTFESAAPAKRKKLGRFKTLSKGLKTYVLSDETSMDEAMAAARGDDEHEVSVQQLEAFQSTFNFCMTCRQYTCANCWNEAEGLCLTCAPLLGHVDVLPTFLEPTPLVPAEPSAAEPFPQAEPSAAEPLVPAEPLPFEASAWPVSDSLPAGGATPKLDEIEGQDAVDEAVGTNEPTRGTATRNLLPRSAAAEWPLEAELVAIPVLVTPPAPEPEPSVAETWPSAEQAAITEAEGDPGSADAWADAELAAGLDAKNDAGSADVWADAELAAGLDAKNDAGSADVWADAEQAAAAGARDDGVASWPAEADAVSADAQADETDHAPSTDVAAAESAAWAEAELAAASAVDGDTLEAEAWGVQPEVVAAEAEPEPEVVAAETKPEPEVVAAEAEPEPEVVAAETKPEPEVVAAETKPEPEVVAAETKPEPEVVAAEAEPEPEVVAAEAEPEPEVVAAEAEPEPEVVAAETKPEPEVVAAETKPELVAAQAELVAADEVAESVESEPIAATPKFAAWLEIDGLSRALSHAEAGSPLHEASEVTAEPAPDVSATEADSVIEPVAAELVATESEEVPEAVAADSEDVPEPLVGAPALAAWPEVDIRAMGEAWVAAEALESAARTPGADDAAEPAAPDDVMAARLSSIELMPGLDERAAAVASRTSELLARLRSMGNSDADVEAIEASPEPASDIVAPAPEEASAEAKAVPEVASWPEVDAASPEVAAAAPEALPDAIAEPEVAAAPAAPEPQPEVLAVEPEVAAVEPEVAAAPVEPEPEPEPVRTDVVEQPTWRIVALEAPTPLPDGHRPVPDPVQPVIEAAAVTPASPPAEPQWPVAQPLVSPDPSFLANRGSSVSAATDALWAASTRNVVASSTGAPVAGVQPCSSCGLSLSATARFCRRCGSRQGA